MYFHQRVNFPIVTKVMSTDPNSAILLVNLMDSDQMEATYWSIEREVALTF